MNGDSAAENTEVATNGPGSSMNIEERSNNQKIVTLTESVSTEDNEDGAATWRTRSDITGQSSTLNGNNHTRNDANVVRDNSGELELATLTSNGVEHNVHVDDVNVVDVGVDIDEENYQKRRQLRDSMYFTLPDKDGKKRRIDYVLVYEETGNTDADQQRAIFQKDLETAGMELEIEHKEESSDGNFCYVKIHCPWPVLLQGATFLKMKKRLKLDLKVPRELGCGCCSCMCLTPNKNVIPHDHDEHFTAVFDEARIDIFNIVDEKTFFTNAERSLIAKMKLDRIEYSFHEPGEEIKMHNGIDYLLQNKIYTGAFPLHEGSLDGTCSNDPSLYSGEDKDRLRLYQAWARPKNIFMMQPLDLIRKYFGEKVAFYFAWLGVYTTMLIPASLFGIACLLYGLITLPHSASANAVCSSEPNSTGLFVMCPACDLMCNYTVLRESCVYARIAHVFDNKATIAMAIFMSAWALVFIEMWKRQQASLQFEWDVGDYEQEETTRPGFQLKVRSFKRDPITGQNKPYLTGRSWFLRRGSSVIVVIFMILFVLGAIFAILIYRFAVVAALFSVNYFHIRAGAKLITLITSSVINLIACLVLSMIYSSIARLLTSFEAHRTQTAYEDSLTVKLMGFQFVNFYGFIFYIAFFKGSFIDPPGRNSMYIFNKYKVDECDPSGCIVDLSIQLAVIMVGKQFLSAVQQILIPWIMSKWRARDVRNKEIYLRWEQDNDLNAVLPLMLFNEYLSMTIQFGFVTLFVTSFPLAPLFALINNLVETRLDAYKMIKMFQRPTAMKAQDIGAWFNVIKLLAFLSVITNGFIIAWTTDLIPKMVYEARNNGSSENYIKDSLAVFNTSNFLPLQAPDPTVFNGTIETCRYPKYRNVPDRSDNVDFTQDYWIILCARLAFVIVFEHVCILIMFCVMVVIPDESGRVKRLRTYELELNRKLMYENVKPTAATDHVTDLRRVITSSVFLNPL